MTGPARPGGYPGRLRIIGGRWRGRWLPVAPSPGLRPTPNRIRETLFNWLRPWLPGARCLDLTAGTGSLCLEALSQGAAEVVMVEADPEVAACLRRNVERLGAGEQARVVQAQALDYLAGPVAHFHIVFLDPPFASDLIGRCAERLEAGGWIQPGGWIYVEAPRTLRPLPVPQNWQLVRSKSAGQVGYHLLRRPEPDAQDRRP